MTTIIPQKLECPKCSTIFNASMLGSYGASGAYSDFCPIYTGAPALFNLLATCPSCSFTAYLDRFEMIDDVEDGIDDFDESLPEEPTEPWGPAKFLAAVDTYKELGEEDAVLADLYLKAYWCFHYDKFPDVGAELCITRSIFHLIEAIDKDQVADKEKVEYQYLVGELSRRSGRFAEAVEWFDKAAATATDDLLKLCTRMKALAEKGDSSDQTA